MSFFVDVVTSENTEKDAEKKSEIPEKSPEMTESLEKSIDDREAEVGPENGENESMEEESSSEKIQPKRLGDQNQNEPPVKKAKTAIMEIIDAGSDSEDEPEEVVF